jgi:hypothetical protein
MAADVAAMTEATAMVTVTVDAAAATEDTAATNKLAALSAKTAGTWTHLFNHYKAHY